MTPDHYLIARAQKATTGANAHEVNQLLAIYTGCVSLSKDYPQLTIRAEELERYVRMVAATGKTDGSWRSLAPLALGIAAS